MPYHTNRIATCSQDSTIKLWEIKEENIADMKTPLADLQGHNLKVNLIAPHHSAKSIIASSSYDKTIKVTKTLNEALFQERINFLSTNSLKIIEVWFLKILCDCL